MNKIVKYARFVFALVLVFSALGFSTSPVKASNAAPLVEYYTWDMDYMLETQPCPGFEVWDHEILTIRITTFFDNDGNVKVIKTHVTDGVDNFYNPERPDFLLSGRFGGNAEIDLQTGNWVNVSGVTANVTVPGYGRVFKFTGHWLVYPTIHLGGLYSLEDPDDMAEFCSLLAVD